MRLQKKNHSQNQTKYLLNNCLLKLGLISIKNQEGEDIQSLN